MNIGIDIDGVLTDIHGFNHKHAPPYFTRKFGREVKDKAPYDIKDIFSCTEDEWKSYWKKYFPRYVMLEPAREGAGEFTQTLRRDGHEVFIISKRAYSWRQDFLGRLMRGIVRNWLWRNRVWYRELVFCDANIHDSKRTACLEKNIDIMIDDEPLNIDSIAPIAKVVCFDTSYNRECEGKNIFRAKDFEETYRLIQNVDYTGGGPTTTNQCFG